MSDWYGPVKWSLSDWLVVISLSLASSSFPYLKKRIQVVEQQSTEMNPIEVAIDEMSRKVSELNQLCNMEEVDMIRLQLKLQGSVSVKVGIISSRTQILRMNLCFLTRSSSLR